MEVLEDAALTATPSRATAQELESARRATMLLAGSKSPTSEMGRAALIALLGLPEADFRVAVLALADAGTLTTLNDVFPEGQDALMAKLVQSGMVGTRVTSSSTSLTSVGAPPPPAPARLFKDDGRLPEPLRDIILAANTQAAASYDADFAAYASDYRAAVEAAPNMAKLRALGPAAEPNGAPDLPPAATDTHGRVTVAVDDPRSIAYQKSREGHQGASATELHAAVMDRAAVLNGKPIAGLSVKAKVEVMAGIGDFEVGVSGEVERKADGNVEMARKGSFTDGTVAVDDGGGWSIKGGNDKVKGSLKHSAKSTAVGVSSKPLDADLSVGVDKDDGLVVEAGAGGIGVGFSSDGRSVGVSASVSKEVGTEEGLHAEAKVEVGYKAQGIGEDLSMAMVSSSDRDFYSVPPELGAGKAWTSLNREDRLVYEAFGWSEKEWNTARDLASFRR